MTSGFAQRFVFEAAFLVLLALAAGLAELETIWIVAVMFVGWVLVAIVEWLAWRSEQADAGVVAPPPAPAGLDESTGWELDDILAPLPEDDA